MINDSTYVKSNLLYLFTSHPSLIDLKLVKGISINVHSDDEAAAGGTLNSAFQERLVCESLDIIN